MIRAATKSILTAGAVLMLIAGSRHANAATPNSAVFEKTDTATKGNWRGIYGGQGAVIPYTPAAPPAGVSVTPYGHSEWLWRASSAEVRDLLKPGNGADRLSSCWYTNFGVDQFSVAINLTDGEARRVALYFVDASGQRRRQKLQLLDTDTGAVLDTRELNTDFDQGVYLVWKVSGRVTVRLTKTGGVNGVLSGIFFDSAGTGVPNPTPTPTPTPGGVSVTFLKADTTSQGDWKGVYGVDGYAVIGDSTLAPSYAVLTPSGKKDWTWRAASSERRDLQKAGSGRIAACWYGNSFEMGLRLTDGAKHRVSAYCADADNGQRQQRIEILNASTLEVLDVRDLTSGFAGGVYLVWEIKGDVVIRVSNLSGPNAVLNGVFLDPVGAAVPTPTPTVPAVALKAKNDSATTDERKTVTVDVLANDDVPAADVATVKVASAGAGVGGTTAIANGRIIYTPRPGFFGQDSFVYSIQAGASNSSATVNVTVRDLSVAHTLASGDLSGAKIGTSAGGASRVISDGTWEVTGQGAGPGGSADNLWFESRDRSGDFQVLTRVRGLSGGSGALAGVLLRDGEDANARYAMIAVTPDGSYRVGSRTEKGGVATQSVPAAPNQAGKFPDVWLLIERRGDTVTLAVSSDDDTYTQSGKVVLDNLPASVKVGLFSSGGNAGASGIAVVDNFQFASLQGMASATFVKTDKTTLGNWKSAYGKDGVVIAGDQDALPGYATVTRSGGSLWTWEGSSSEPRALERYVAGSGRLAVVWYENTFSFDVNITDKSEHQMAVSFLDWPRDGRAQNVEIIDPETGIILSSQALSNFPDNAYLVWNVSGSIRVRITRTAGPNAVVNAILFGGPLGNSAPSPTPTPDPLPTTTFVERILNANGSLNTAEYVKVAESLDQPWARDYFLGPKWTDFHAPSANTDPTVAGRAGALPLRTLRNYDRSDNTPNFRPEAGWLLHLPPGANVETRPIVAGIGDWYAQSGNLLYTPDAASDAGFARARAFADYHENQGTSVFTHAFDLRVSWLADPGNYFNRQVDPSIDQPSWIAASGGVRPRSPVALARSRTMHVTWPSVVAFRNGLIGVTSNGNAPDKFAYTKLPAGRIPTAIALTQNNEFALVTVWNTATLKGELAVLACKGRFPQSDTQQYWGLPNGMEITSLKILGYVDLPGMSAPGAISAVTNVTKVLSGRGGPKTPSLDTQGERDNWYNGVDGLHTVSQAGFAVISSRAENKVAFVDLEPLFQYFRKMYLTSASNFNQTKNEGAAANQWPYDFSVVPEAKPVLSQLLAVNQPTAVVAGYPYPSDWGDGAGWEANNEFKGQAWVASMDGKLRMYRVDGLFNVGPATAPQLFKTVQLGLNPTCINVGRTNSYSKVFITCRGDRVIYQLDLNGVIKKVLRDSRLVDPVAATGSFGRGPSMLSVMDFAGKQIHNYMREPINVWGDIILGGLGLNGNAPFEFTHTTPVPGYPFFYDVTEVN